MPTQKTIFVIDDEQDLVEMIRIKLEFEGFEVITACNGREALERIKDFTPDLILLDVMMPQLDGYQVCRKLKADSKYKHIPVIMFTAKAQENDKLWGEECGADAYLTKPYSFDDLLKKINTFLFKKAAA